MLFDNSKLELLAHNFVRVKQEKTGFFYFQRFLDEQLEVYAGRPLFRQGSECPSGIYLLFKTAGTRISFECKKESTLLFTLNLIREIGKLRLFDNLKIMRKYGRKSDKSKSDPKSETETGNVFDVFVNDQKVASPKLKNGIIEFDFENASKSDVFVKIYFPLTINAGIKNLTGNGSIEAVSEPQPKEKFYAFGDSITQGYTTRNPSSCYVALVAEALHLDGHNQGVGGYYYDPAVLDGFEKLPHSKFITVAYGTNDWFFNPSLDAIRENVRNFYKRLNVLFADIPVFVITPFWRADMNDPQESGEFMDLVRLIEKEASQYSNMVLVDGLQISPHENSFYADGFLHPNARGFAYIAERLVPIITSRVSIQDQPKG